MSVPYAAPLDEATQTQAGALDKALRHYLANPTASWGLGTFGAVAEFHRTADEPVRTRAEAPYEVVTERGAIRITSTQGLRALAYELPGAAAGSWHHAVALCLPTSQMAMHRREVLTECGPDTEALRPEDREAILFDIGLGTPQVDVCIRTADPQALTACRAVLGRAALEHGNPLMPRMPQLSPHRVFLCRFARVEVYQRIPGPQEEPPVGPHTHVLPNLLKHQRSHAATVPIPEGWVPCLHFYPASPLVDALGKPRPFDRAAYEDFQGLLHDFGDPTLVRLKTQVFDSLRAGQAPEVLSLPTSRVARATVRVALRQWAYTEGDGPLLAAWRQQFDRSETGEELAEDDDA